MNEPVPRAIVEGFYAALAVRDMPVLAGYLDADVSWTISGPIDVLPFCGQRRGKGVVIDLLERDSPLLFEKRKMVPDVMLVDGDKAAVFGKMTARRRDAGRAISYRIAQFLRFENEKLVEYVSIIDSFDAVEQVLGHQLELPGGMRGGDGELVAV